MPLPTLAWGPKLTANLHFLTPIEIEMRRTDSGRLSVRFLPSCYLSGLPKY